MNVGSLVKSPSFCPVTLGIILDVMEMEDGHMYYEVQWYGDGIDLVDNCGWYDEIELQIVQKGEVHQCAG